MSKQTFKLGEVYDPKVAELPIDERKDVLEGICYDLKVESYTKQLTKEELTEKKSRLAEVSISLSEIADRKKEAMASFKAEAVEPETEKKELLTAIKYKSETRTGVLYHVDDQETQLMYSFDENAVCVDVRPLKQDEKQTKMRNLNLASNE